MSLTCKLSIPEVEGLTSQQLTVGRHFNLNCSGEMPLDFKFSQAQLILPDEHKYEFVLSRIEKPNIGELKLDVVSHVTGEFSLTELNFSDGSQQIVLSIPKVKVDSILPPPEPSAEGTVQKPPEPYGFVVSSLSWPVGYTVFFVVIFCAAFALLIQQFLKRKRFRRLIKELEDFNSALSPDLQFYKHMRLLEKQDYPIQEIEKQFKIYITRKYQVPFSGMSLNESISYLKKKWPTFITERRDLKNILLDLKKMNEGSTIEENKKYLKKLYQFVDHSEQKIGETR